MLVESCAYPFRIKSHLFRPDHRTTVHLIGKFQLDYSVLESLANPDGALMQARGFTAEQFGRYHPEGQLGRNLRVKVSEVMHSGGEVAWVRPQDSLKQVVIAMSARPLGAACVVSNGDRLAGLITDGDLRRALERHDDIRTLVAGDVMTASPVSIDPDALAHDALCLMEDRPSQISVLPVVDAAGHCAGLVRLHDLYHPGRGPR